MNKVNHIEVEFVTRESPGNEQVLLEPMKEYLRLLGFIPDGESPAASLTDFDDDDTIIDDMITAAVTYLETSANVSLRHNELTGTITNMAGRTELLYSPINEITELLDSDGDEIESDDYETVGISRRYLITPLGEDMKITYTTYPLTGKAIENSIKRLVAYLYEHRGDELEDNQIRQKADSLCSSYTRNSAWA